MARLSDLSAEIAQVAAGLAPSLVRVDARGGRPATGIIWADNLVLTADHVIEADDNIEAPVVGYSFRDLKGNQVLGMLTSNVHGAPLPESVPGKVRLLLAMLALEEGREVRRPETEPVGCSVKWRP